MHASATVTAAVYEVAALSSLIRKGAERFIRMAAVVLAGNGDGERIKAAARELTMAGGYLEGLTGERPVSGRPTTKQLSSKPRRMQKTSVPASRAASNSSGRSGRISKQKHFAYVVAPSPAGGWQVVREGGKRAIRATSRSEAVARANEIAAKSGGGELIVHEKTGSVERRVVSAARGATVYEQAFVDKRSSQMAKQQRHVVRDGDEWVVRKPGADRASSRHDTQREADQRAAEILRNVGGGERVTHGRDGQIRSKDTISPGNDPNPPRDKEH